MFKLDILAKLTKVQMLTLLMLMLLLVLSVLDSLFPLTHPFNYQAQDSGQKSRHFATTVLDIEGRPLRAFADSNGIWRHQVELSQVSPLYLQALLNYEDRYFYHHFGVNPLSILRAMWLNISNGRMVSGGSTLTMQVARLLYPHSRTISGKLYQMLRALQLEWHYSKDEILTLYINLAPFGGTIEGVQAASFSYLDKDISDLTHAEAALLAVLPQAPTRYRPDLRPQKARKARDKVLERMVSLGIWRRELVDDAKIEQVDKYRASRPMVAPLLARRLKPMANKGVVQTTINGHWQQGLEQMLKRYTSQLPQGASGAVLVVDNHTGAVKAYLGSADFADNSRYGHVDMIRAIRSPGSTLKPFLFAFALEQGLIHSHSLLSDVPLHTGEYRPSNFGGGFKGPISASDALKRSLNVPFVTLLKHLGPVWFDGRLKGAGLPLRLTGDQANYRQANLAIILGGAGASLEQLVGAFAGFANDGQALKLKWLKSQLQSAPQQRFLTTKSAAWVTYQTLSQIDRPGSINNAIGVSNQHGIAWKTGTSYGFRDSWAIGTNKNYTIGVWLGRPDNSPMPGHYGRKTAGPLLFSAFNYIDPNGRSPKAPKNVTQATICWPLGTELAHPIYQQNPELCHQQHTAWLVDQTAPATLTDIDNSKLGLNPMPYWLNLDNGLRLAPHCGGERFANKTLKQLPLWPANLMSWIKPQWRLSHLLPKPDPACQGVALSIGQGLSIKGIIDGSILRYQGGQYPQLRLQAIGANASQHWYIDGVYYKTIKDEQYLNYQFDRTGEHQILVIDDSGAVAKVEVRIITGI